MPGFDGMGPQGAGPGTGRRRGKCFNQDLPGDQFYGRRGMGRGRGGFGRGYGRGGYGRGGFGPNCGQGFGPGFGPRFGPPPFFNPPQLTKEQKIEILENEKKAIEAELAEIQKGIEELKKTE